MSKEFSTEFSKLVSGLGLDQVIQTLQDSTGNPARISQSSDRHPSVHAGRGHEETSRTYTVPLRRFRGKVVEDIIKTQTVNPGLEHTPDREVAFKVGEKPSRRVIDLEDNIKITITERSGAPEEATIELETTRHRSSPKLGSNVFVPQKRFGRMNIEGGMGEQTKLLTKVTDLLENIDS